MTKVSDLLKRNSLAARKALWRLFHNYAPNARAVYVLGAQRSGTTLLIDCFEKSMEFDVLGESSKAMVNYRIRSDDVVAGLIRSSRHRVVVFKPLTDSHRVHDFLNLTPGSVVIWAFRRVEDRANSAVAKFGDHNLEVLREFARGEGLDRWQAQGLTKANLDLIRSFDYADMMPETASAIFWYIRNSLFFSNGLENSDRVLPLAYEDLVSQPGATMQGVCRFVGGEFRNSMISDIHAKSIGLRESMLPQHIQQLCAPMYEKLHKIQEARWHGLNLREPGRDARYPTASQPHL